MHTSIANYRPPNHERSKVRELIPQYLRDGASNLISFMEEYYDYLNREGFASYELGHTISENDIDVTSEKYLDAIQGEIAKIVPNSNVVDRNTLYKRIIHYYRIKGTPESVSVFFQIMFDSMVEVYYPSDNLFKLSAGTYASSSEYTKRNGDLSGIDKIQDSYFWQDFSYQIKSAISTERWIDSFERLVHPAGMKFFVAALIHSVLINRWEDFQTYTGTVDEPDSWLKDLLPPRLRTINASEGYHTPKYQPGWLNAIIAELINPIFENYYGSSEPNNPNNSSFDRSVIIDAILKIINTNWSNSINANQYFTRGFWDDPACLSEQEGTNLAPALAHLRKGISSGLTLFEVPLSLLINEYQQEYKAGRLETVDAPQPSVEITTFTNSSGE